MGLPEPHPRVLSRRLNDEVVLVHLDTNQIYALNQTGARFWELLAETRDRAAVEESLQAEFEVEPHVLTAEIDRLVGELRALGLVREA